MKNKLPTPRDILFRAKSRQHGMWVFGLPKIKDGRMAIQQYLPDLLISYPTHIIDPVTLGECTGLKDKNGFHIFEGDILQKRVYSYAPGATEPNGSWLMVGRVFWCDKEKHFPGFWAIAAKDQYGNQADYIFTDEFEIIGNVYDNPNVI